ncbi:MAG: cytochrome b/b6 domain-containing protein [Pseudomonadota bacterium]
MVEQPQPDPEPPPPAPKPEVIYRHKLATRITHWINLLCITFLLMSGFTILNAHPRLYWGQYGANHDTALFAIDSVQRGGQWRGYTHIGPLTLETTGLLGASEMDGHIVPRGLPAWLTLPSYRDLATGRRWHFFLAWLFVLNGLTYLAFGFLNGHFKRDIAPNKDELKPKHLWADIVAHAKLHVPRGEESKRYNTLQKIAYIGIIFVILPVMILTGLSMSPGFDAFAPALPQLFGGRQSARTIHFITANLIVLFVFVHLFEVFLVGAWNEIRSMVTGYYEVKPEKAK